MPPVRARPFGQAPRSHWNRRVPLFYGDRSAEGGERPWHRTTSRSIAYAGIALLCALFGAAVALGELSALYLCLSLIGCAFILFDFRAGVVLLILLMPISSSAVFPRAMLGITGLNPLNLLLAATLVSCLLQGLFDGSIRRFLPRPLLWLYIAPFLAAGMLGASHFGDIAPAFFMYHVLSFDTVGGYARDLLMKPLFYVAFALLVAAA